MMSDEKSPIFGNVSVIDVPVVDEISYDYDEMRGVIDDWSNPYDQTKPIEVYIPLKPKLVLDALGGQCRICRDVDSKILSVRRIRNPQKSESSKYLKELVEDMIEKGKDPSREFCIVCLNCIMYIKKISNVRRSSGLSDLTIDDLEQVFTK